MDSVPNLAQAKPKTCCCRIFRVSSKGGFSLTLTADHGFYQNMKSLLLVALCSFVTLTSYGSTFQGVMSRLKNKPAITVATTERKLLLTPYSAEIGAQLSKLKNADFISLEGRLSEDGNSILVGSINFVGLKDLVGNWSGDDEYCYRFQNYFTLKIYNKANKDNCDFTPVNLAREFSYIVNPSAPNWSVLLSDTEDSYLMDLTLNSKNSAELSLYDSRTGDILRTIKIKR